MKTRESGGHNEPYLMGNWLRVWMIQTLKTIATSRPPAVSLPLTNSGSCDALLDYQYYNVVGVRGDLRDRGARLWRPPSSSLPTEELPRKTTARCGIDHRHDGPPPQIVSLSSFYSVWPGHSP